jgi:molybdenum cofactor biosynthesis protein MoaC
MVDVGEKAVTFRRAVARGRITMGKDAFTCIVERRVPKGDVLALAEVSGIQAAKRTSEILPLCHPLLIEKVRVRAMPEPETSSICVESEVQGNGKTGFEMEALTAVSAALLCVYDLVKALDPAMTISGIALAEKEGGKSGHWHATAPAAAKRSEDGKPVSLSGVKAARITVSDRVSRREAVDKSGPAIDAFLTECGAELKRQDTVSDDKNEIAQRIRDAAAHADLVVLTGGTGLSPRDVTPDAIASVCDRLIPGFGEKLRAAGAVHTPFSYLSRSCAGLLGRALVIALPGSEKAVREGLEALAILIPHALHTARGGDHA